MKNLIMVAPYFLPRRRVGAQRPFKFAIHLRELGWQPHVITISSSGKLTTKEQKLLEDVLVYNLTPPFDRTTMSESQITQSSIISNGFSVADWIDMHFPMDTWLPFFMFRWFEIKKIVTQINPDAIWSTGDPWSAHWVGNKISKIFPDAFWMADFRDPWTLSDTDLKKRSCFASAIDRKIESYLIQQASMLSFTTQSTRKLYEEFYSELDLKMTTIYNSFDRELFDDQNNVDLDSEISDKQLNLIFFGRFRTLSPAKPVIDILNWLKSEEIKSELSEKIQIHCFGPLNESDKSYAIAKAVEDCFVVHEAVPVEQAVQVLNQADILLLSTSPERKDIIPAKLWDYLASDRPILSIAPNPEIAHILEKTGAGMQLNNSNISEIAKLLKKCIIAKQQRQELPIEASRNSKAIAQYNTQSATEKLVTILDDYVA